MASSANDIDDVEDAIRAAIADAVVLSTGLQSLVVDLVAVMESYQEVVEGV